MDSNSANDQSSQMRLTIGNMKDADDAPNQLSYSMPGILHFLQTEWARFEMERAQWDVERAELQVFR